jgi:succinate dehydrogenase/fumarate reductase flavoprotein subunit
MAGEHCAKIINQLQSEKIKHCDDINNLISSKIDGLKAVLWKSPISSDDKKHCSLSSLKIDLQKNNDKNLSVFRNQSLLIEGLKANFNFYKKLKTYIFSNKNLLWNQELIDYLELENLLLNAIATNIAALHRLESRGAHYRSDFNYRDDDKFLAHSLVGIKKIDKIMAEDLNIDLLIDLTESANIIDNSIGNSNYQFLLRKVRNYTEIEELKLIPSPRNY